MWCYLCMTYFKNKMEKIITSADSLNDSTFYCKKLPNAINQIVNRTIKIRDAVKCGCERCLQFL